MNIPKERCIQVSADGAGALEELREGLEKLCFDSVLTVLTKDTLEAIKFPSL